MGIKITVHNSSRGACPDVTFKSNEHSESKVHTISRPSNAVQLADDVINQIAFLSQHVDLLTVEELKIKARTLAESSLLQPCVDVTRLSVRLHSAAVSGQFAEVDRIINQLNLAVYDFYNFFEDSLECA